MTIKRITLIIGDLYYLLARDEKYSCDDIFKQIEQGDILDKLRATYLPKYDDLVVGGLLNGKTYTEDEQQIVEALQRLANAETPEDYGITDRNNGLLFLAGLFNTLIQANVTEIELK